MNAEVWRTEPSSQPGRALNGRRCAESIWRNTPMDRQAGGRAGRQAGKSEDPMIIQSTSPSFGSTETFGPPCIQKGGMAPHDANQQRSADEQRQENPWALLEEDRWRLYNEVRTAADGKSYSWPEFQAWYGTAAKQEWARAGASTPADIDPDTRAGASTPAHIHPDALKGSFTSTAGWSCWTPTC